MSSFIQDVRFGARMMRKSPGLTLVAVATLALGIGANSSIFSVVNAVLLRPLPYLDPGRLVLLWGTAPDIPKEEASLPDYVDWKAQSRSFAGMAAVRFMNANVASEGKADGEAERVLGARATHDFFQVLGVRPAIGRDFSPEEDRPGAARVVVLGHGLWQRRFGGDPRAVGTTLRINEEPYTIVGVLPAGFRLPVSDAALYLPLALDPATTGRRNDAYVVAGRLKPEVELASAQAEMTEIMRRLEKAYPDTNTGWTVRVVPMLDDVVGDYRLSMLLLFAAVGCVLLIACANVANLLLARATARRKELAIRAALGAGKWALVRQLLVESTLLATVGGALGLFVAVWGKEALLAVSPVEIPRLGEATLDLQVLAFSLGLSLLTGILFGLAPAVHAVRATPQGALQEAGRGLVGDARSRIRGLLVVAQLCLALVLLVGTGLAIRSFTRVRSVDPGFDTGPALTARIALPAPRYGADGKAAIFFAQLKERLLGLPGVAGVTFANVLPVSGGGPFWSFSIEGTPAPPPGSAPDANFRIVDADYFKLMRIPLRAGRLPGAHETDKTPRVLVINETLARQIWPNAPPLGKRIAFGQDEQNQPIWWEIVGIVADVKHDGLDKREVRAVYAPLAQAAGSAGSVAIVVRAGNSPAALTPALRNAIRALDPSIPLYSVRTLDDILSTAVQARRFGMLLLGFFGLVALVLAGIGIYSVMSYSVTQRTHEIGVRMALGAARRDVVRMVVGQGMILAVAGLVLGGGVALATVSLASSLLFEVSPFDPIAFVVGALSLGGISLVACLIPAARASSVDPMVALRHD